MRMILDSALFGGMAGCWIKDISWIQVDDFRRQQGPLDLAMWLALGEIRVDVGFGLGRGGILIWHEIWVLQ